MTITNSGLLSVLITSVLLGAVSITHAAPPDGKGKPGRGDGDTTTGCDYPSFSDSPKDKLRGSEADFWGNYGDQVAAIKTPEMLVFSEDGTSSSLVLDGYQQSKLNGQWFVEDMVDIQHRVGPDAVPGRRYTAWYDWAGSINDVASTDGEHLALGGIVSGITDTARLHLTDYQNKLYTTWLSTFQRKWENFGSAKDGSLAFEPPMYLETKVDFINMQTPGFRLSMWLMPVENPNDPLPGNGTPSIAYDSDFKNGYEIDIFEYEPVKVIASDPVNGIEKDVCGNLIEFSWINSFSSSKGRKSSDANGKNHFEGYEEGYCTDQACSSTYANNGIQPDLNDANQNGESAHTIGLLWTKDNIVWSFNGEIVLEINGQENISERPHYLIVSREMTTGQVSEDGSNVPIEPGLYGFNGNSDVGNNTQYIATDKALIDYINVWGNLVTYPIQ